MARLLDEGGWWPGELRADDLGPDFVPELVLRAGPVEPTVRWVIVGAVWESDSFFVEWLTHAPGDGPTSGLRPGELVPALLARRRIRQRATTWTTDHPCWVPDLMPILTDGDWPAEAIAAALGIPVDQVRAG